MQDATILVTGFQPYGGRGLNPAFEAMQRLDGRSIAQWRVVGRSLPVSIARLPAAIAQLLEEVNPSAVISLGLWPGEAVIRIERIAVNIADFEIADNEGALVVDGVVDENGPDALQATLPVRAIERAILATGIPARVSPTAGTFLCNACLYSFLKAAADHPRQPRCGFLHIPYLPEQVADLLVSLRQDAKLEMHQRKDLASMSLEHIVRAVEAAISEC